MQLPEPLRRAIEAETSIVPGGELARASARLSAQYRAREFARAPLDSSAARAAYLAVRLPATFAANALVFSGMREAAPTFRIRSVLDLGAGPGTAAWAACETFPEITRVTLVERDAALLTLGRRLASSAPHAAFRSAAWIAADLERPRALEPHDLVVLSYALGELSPRAAHALVASAWNSSSILLAIVEPGTPRNFARLLDARSWLISHGAHLVAPCPHQLACPLAGAGDWCHFAARVERTSAHRRAKAAALGHEDEKFSYLVAGKAAVTLPSARIVRHPQTRPGHVQLTLCTSSGVERPAIGRSQKEIYRAARRASWGDPWPNFQREE
jgi:ribosomal protein RSM22 (predicted rRNA methylase)